MPKETPTSTDKAPTRELESGRAGRSLWPAIAVVLVATLLLGSVSLIYPFGRDQGIHAYIADAMLSGKVVYRDVFNIKPPLTTPVHAAALLLFGHSMTSIRILDLLWTMAVTLLVFFLVYRGSGRRWAAASAACIYPLLYYLLSFWHTAQTDGWLNLPVAGALLLGHTAVRRNGRMAWLKWAGAGLLIGVATLFKYTAGIVLPLLAVVLLWRTQRARAKGLVALVAGFAVSLAVAALALVVTGAMPAFIESQFRLVPAYSRISPGAGLLSGLGLGVRQMFKEPGLRPTGVVLVLGLAGAIFLFLRLRSKEPGRALLPLLGLVWFAAGAISLLSQGKFFNYHYLGLIGAAALLSGSAFSAIGGRLRRTSARAVVLLGLVALLGIVSGYPHRLGVLYQVASGSVPLQAYWRSPLHNSGRDFSLGADLALVDYVTEHTEPGDRVYIWGYEPLVYFLSRRPTVSRFIYNFPLVVSWSPPGFERELLTALERDPPVLFIVAHGDQTPWVTGHNLDSFQALLESDSLRTFVERIYRPEARINRFDVYRRVN